MKTKTQKKSSFHAARVIISMQFLLPSIVQETVNYNQTL